MSETGRFIEVEKMSVDQLAGAFVMIAGAIGSLLLVMNKEFPLSYNK